MRIRPQLFAAIASTVTLSVTGLALAAGVAGSFASAGSLPRCKTGSIHLVVERSEAAATQAVAFVAVLNTGSACLVHATASLSVVADGRKLDAVRGNPVTYAANWVLRRGRTLLFDAWWANWCGNRQKSRFRARSVFGQTTASAAYPVLPLCLSPHHPSDLTGVVLAR